MLSYICVCVCVCVTVLKYKRRISVQFSIIFRIDHRPHYSPHQTNLWVNLNQQRRFTSPTRRAPSARSDCCGRMDAHGVHTSEQAPNSYQQTSVTACPEKCCLEILGW